MTLRKVALASLDRDAVRRMTTTGGDPIPECIRTRRGLPNGLVQSISVIVGLTVWEVAARIWEMTFLPPVSMVLARTWDLFRTGAVWGHLGTSLTNLALGFGISVIVGITLGVLIAWFPLVEAALDPYVYALFTAPVLVFAPIFMAIFGLGRESIVGVVIMYTVFLIIINTAAGVKSARPELMEMAASYGAGQREQLRHVVIPAAMPMIMAGLRLGMGRAVKGMINGEMFIAVVGLGGIVKRAGSVFDSVQVLAIVLIIVMLALVLSYGVRWLESQTTAWLPKTSR